MKKIIALLLVAVMMLSLVACGGSKAPAETKAPAADAPAADAPAADAGTTEYPVIRMAYTRLFSTEDEPLVEAAMNEILREIAQAEIDLVPVDFGSMQTQFNLLLSGGSDSIDIFSSFWYMPLATLHANGQLADLTELLNAHPEVLDLFKDYPEVLECCKVNGQYYALPTVAPYSSPMLFLVKETDAKNANIDWTGVDTLDEVTEVIRKLKEANPDAYYIPGATETYWVPKDIDYLGDTQFLGVLTDPLNSTTVENYYESEYFINFLENVKAWQELGVITPDPMSNTMPNLMALQMGMCNGTPGYGWDLEEWCYEANTQGQYGDNIVGCQIGDRLITTGNVGTYLWHITSFAKDKEAAMRVLAAFYTNTELNHLLGNGVEGNNYVVNEAGLLAYPEGEDNTNCGWTGMGASYNLPNSNGCTPWFFQPSNFWELVDQTNKESKPSLALGFNFDASEVADQVTACANVVAQYYLPLINGELDIDATLPVFQQALRDAGIEDIVAAKQAQLDAWLASK